MSEENNLVSNNLCITEDAFERFQVDSQYAEEDYITLADIASPERSAPQLPKDIEIPYDNEVVLSNFDDQPSGVAYEEFIQTVCAEPIEQLDSTPTVENNASIEQSVEQTPEENESGLSSRPKRTRKPANYSDDYISTTNFKTEAKKSIESQNLHSGKPPNKSKRGRSRKPKQNLITQNEPTLSETVKCDTPLEQTPVAPKRGRKRVSNNIQPDVKSQTSSTVKRSGGRRGRKAKVAPVEGDLPPEEQHNNLSAAEQPDEMAFEKQIANDPSADLAEIEANNLCNELIINNSDLIASSSNTNIPKKVPKNRGRKKKTFVENSSEFPQSGEVSNSAVTKVNSSTADKKKGRKKKSVQSSVLDNNLTTTFDDKATESDDDLDNLSLQALSQKHNSNEEDQVSINENKLSNDIDVGYDELGKVQEFLSSKCEQELEINTEPQDMELDDPVDSSHTPTILDSTIIQDLPVKVEKIEDVPKIEINNFDDFANDSLLVEDNTKRPRRTAKKILKYEEESDEDPFANVELSDEEPSGKRKGRYQDDDEYVPEIESKTKKNGRRGRSISESEDSDIDLELEQFGKKRKRGTNRTPQKRGRKDTTMSHDSSKDSSQNANLCVTTIPPAIDLEDDIEVCLQSSVIQANKDNADGDSSSAKPSTNVWANTNEFESFIAQKIQGTNLQIKKVSSNQPSQSLPLEIPVLDPEAKKLVEKEVQTNTTKKSAIGVQTMSKLEECPMKDNVTLTSEQSEQACEFLRSIVKTTSELGQLMTDKSEDFITKKIHTAHVTDTFKMDYCVKKSFLLLKLAKHNIVQMEEDLSKQYEEFLKRTDLLRHREEEKVITAKEKDNDSDCEIVEEPSVSSKSQKAKFNPKTVFLNKELSIKIAKKPQQSNVEKKCQQLGVNKHSVWINDSVMVKKVKHTQSFLAQDSRNKKPPDCFVTEKMVSDFFRKYYQKLAPLICAPFTSTEWVLSLGKNYMCSYFFVKADKFAGASFPNNEEICLNGSASSSGNNSMDVSDLTSTTEVQKSNPQSLLCLCTDVLKKHMNMLSVEEKKTVNHPCTLFRLCVNTLRRDHKSFISHNYSDSNQYKEVSPDQPKNELAVAPLTLCNKKLNEMSSCSSKCDDIGIRQHTHLNFSSKSDVLSENTQSDFEHADNTQNFTLNTCVLSENTKKYIEHADVVSLKTLCYRILCDLHFFRGNTSLTARPYTENVSEDHDLSVCESFSDIASKSCNDENLLQDDFFEQLTVPTLLTLCHKKIVELIPLQEATLTCDTISDGISVLSDNDTFNDELCLEDALSELCSLIETEKVSSLKSLCVKAIQETLQMTKYYNIQNIVQENTLNVSELYKKDMNTKFIPSSLKCISFHFVKDMMFRNINKNENVVSRAVTVTKVKKLMDLCFEIISAVTAVHSNNSDPTERISIGMTIDSVNTVSEDVYHNMEEDENETTDEDTTLYDEDNFRDDYDNVNENHEDNLNEENSWVTQLKLQVQQQQFTVSNQANNDTHVTENSSLHSEDVDALEAPILVHVKQETFEESPDTNVDSSTIKAEPLNHDETVCVPENVFPKMELNRDDNEQSYTRLPPDRRGSSSFDVNSFEDFVRRNKMMHALDDPNVDTFSFNETGHRVRRQHEPDYMNEYDPSLNLLVPQTFEPISVENAKGVLMESSSDEEGKKSGQKKGDKRGRGRPRKGKPNNLVKTQKIALEKTPLVKEKPPPVKEKVPPPPAPNEVAMLTRRMREKIRQEEKKVQSSDSESENVPLARKKDKDRKEKKNEKTKSKNDEPPPIVDERSPLATRKNKDCKENEKTKSKNDEPLPTDDERCDNVKALKNQKTKTKPIDDDIQCNNVDSTEQIENINDSTDNNQKFTGFSAVDQNEITSYEKYVKFVYDKILPKDTPAASPTNQRTPEPSTNENEDDDRSETPLIDYDEPAEMLECEPTMPMFDEEYEQKKTKPPKVKSKVVKNKNAVVNSKSEVLKEAPVATELDKPPIYNERDGWHCYPIDPKEVKLYQNPALILDKLPEDFVETYFRYQEISYTRKEDKEVDRLINLNTLNRTALKEGKKPKLKGKLPGTESHTGRGLDSSRPATPNSDACDELTASEDEGANVDDEIPPEIPLKSSDNHLAKDSLMNESDSDDALSKIKQEKCDDEVIEKPKPACKKKQKKIEKVEEPIAPENLMLTADKMMKEELNLLHAPVVLSNELDTSGKGPSPKSKHRSGSKKNSSRDHIKNEEDSSSEEEKQWVNTKEKLLKRMVKKHDTALADDAKRAKLVCDFIERRELTECRKRKIGGGRRRVSWKKLERQKQMRVLQHELLGSSLDHVGARHGKYTQSVFKGRRNIRKVIDKKSLARSTVIANMEEFERKRRLSQQQARLRELLGCEEGVNVLVINDEVCLEYGFEEQRPLVTVHPFFTKVMKAHQYEGVKFMWDACFESLEQVESGNPGGGCILAHCMGLGKTLQVLALLHTVLTHPRVGMQRVLVCCPLSTVLNWVDEIHKWIGPVTDQIKVFELSKLKKTYERAYQLEDWYSGGGIFIIGYELFRSLTTLDPEIDDVRQTIVNKIRTALLDPGPDIIVCDEGHLLKNDCSVLAVAMSRVATKRRIVLTGTPMQNNLREYYCMVNFIKPNLLGTYSEYSNRFENPIMNGQHRDSQEEDIKLMKQRTHILHKVLEGCLQRQEASVLYPYLPKKHEYTVFISLTQVQWDLYKHYLENYSQKGNKHSILKDFHILQKIWSHPQVLHNFQMRRRNEAATKLKAEKLEDDLAREDLTATEDLKPLETDEVWWLQYQQNPEEENMLDCLASSNKFVVVFKILDECVALGDKVLIFSTSLFTMDALEYFLKKINKWSLGQEYYRLDGSVPAEVRQKWCREFNAEHNHKTKLFLISTRAGCLGLNMVAANRVIILDTSWNPAHDIQSIFRVYRFGQKKDCYIYRLVALGTMEQKIYERSVTKQAVACRVVDEQQIDRHYNMAELTELYKYDEEGSSVSSGVAVGVVDVALLRVARHPALHAVHEHDSLLRGSSEQQLPEHERAAAWMQFQQEHAHKQMQNELTSSFSLHIPVPLTMPNGMMVNIPNLQIPGPSQHFAPEVKQETPDDPTFQPTPEPKGKRGKKKLKEQDALFNTIPLKTYARNYRENTEAANQPESENQGVQDQMSAVQDPPENPKMEAQAVEAAMIQEIMGILLKHNFQERRGPKEIAELVTAVRKMVTYGKPPRVQSKISKSIADFLLVNEGVFIATAEDDPLRKTIQRVAQKKKGRPKKGSSRETSDTSAPPTPQPSTSEFQFNPAAFPGRRRAAIYAEKQIDTITSFDHNDGDSWQDADADWHGGDVGAEEIVPETRGKRKTNKRTPIEETPTKETPTKEISTTETPTKETPIKLEKDDSAAASSKENACNSIVLSDDEPEPQPQQSKKKLFKLRDETNPTEKEKEPVAEEITPLHPSLLSNKNFIKIVAHTYLEGNPMLDEDAATLAAQYSTLKAKKELESTGKPIVSGPIYDIAIKVLGIDILKKLNKTNPIKITPAPIPEATVKTEPDTAPANSTPTTEPPMSAAKEKTVVKSEQKTAEVEKRKPEVEKRKAEDKPPEVEKRRPGPRLKARKLIDLTESGPSNVVPAPAPVASSLPTATPYAVPVGLINRTRSQGPREPFAPPLAAPFAPPQAEESILPDDDDVIAGDDLPPAPAPAPLIPKSMFRKNAKPLVLNSVLASSSGVTPQKREPIPKLIISAGKLMPISKVTSETPPPAPKPPAPTPPPQTSNNDTICLDSDEDEIISTPAPLVKKRPVATKSTTKLPHAQPSPPVPVSISTSNPQLNAMLNQPAAAPPSPYMYGMQQHRPVNPTPNPNYLVIPSAKLTKLPPGVRPAMHNLQQHPQQFPGQSILPNPVPTAIHTSMGYMHSMYQDAPQMISQNINYDQAPVPTMLITPGAQPMITSVSQPHLMPQPPLMHQPPPMPQPAPVIQPPPMPQQAPMQLKPDNKTVCKPGDILRITASGQVEILNRNEDPVMADTAPAAAPTIPEPSERLRRLRDRLSRGKAQTSVTPPPASKPAPALPKLAPATSKPFRAPSPVLPVETQQPETLQKSPDRIRKISSSSSSSEESRPPTPDDDPLSILRDVVHIKAPEDNIVRNSRSASKNDKAKPSPASNNPSSASNKPSPASNKPAPASKKSTTMFGDTSITKSGPIQNRPGPASSAAKHLRGMVTKPSTPQKTPDEVRKHISNTDTILKKLDKSLGLSPNSKTIDTIDLDDYDQPSTSSKPSNKSSDAKKQTPSKPKEAPKKEPCKKVVGTGKEIIISITGKSPGLSTTSSANKNIRVTNVEKIQAPAAKRSAPQPAPPPQKKKKTEPMTLKDFNIDDIDDIIELD